MKIINKNLRHVITEGYYIEIVTNKGIIQTDIIKNKKKAKETYKQIKKLN